MKSKFVGSLRWQWLASLGLLASLSGCYHPGLKAMQEFEKNFACSPDDFEDLQALVQKYFSGSKSFQFSDGSEGAFLAAVRLNELIANKCPRSTLRRCASGNEKADLYIDADETHSLKQVSGPLEEFGVLALTDINYETIALPKPLWLTEVAKSKVFENALQCFAGRN